MTKSREQTGNRNVTTSGMKHSRKHHTWFWFLLPALIIVVSFFLLPVLITMFISMTNMSSSTGLQGWTWIGVNNYLNILRNPETAQHFQVTVMYVLFTLVFFNIGMGLVISLITTHIPKKTGYFFRAIWLLPRITPPVVYILMWKIIAAAPPYGILTTLILEPLGIADANLVPDAAFLFIVLVNGFVGASFGMIIFTSAIESIRKDIMISSLVDGASILQRIRYIILPQLRWPLLFVTTYQTLSLLTSYKYIFLLTGGNYKTEVWSLWAYNSALNNYWGTFQYGLGAALATVLVVVGLIMSLIYLRYFRFEELVQEPRIDQL